MNDDQFADAAIARMRSPYEMHIICVDVTNKCDLHCSNCTRLLKNQTSFWDMTPDNFRLALRSLRGFNGVIAMIGGNPCVHKQFEELCRIFAEEIPNKSQRGLWSNNLFDYEQLIADTFGFFNLNPHNDQRGRKSLERLKKLIPRVNFFNGHSHHSPLLTAVQDLYPDKAEMWDQISTCDINRQWSATVLQNKGELRAYFCEVAGSFDLARGEDNGYPVVEGWWCKPLQDFASQVKKFCPGCGVPARLKGHLDSDEIDTYSRSNAKLAEQSLRKRRKIIEINSLEEAENLNSDFTNYNNYHQLREHTFEQRDGLVGTLYRRADKFIVQPGSVSSTDPGNFTQQELPAYVTNLLLPDDSVLLLGPGYSTKIVDIARRARFAWALDPDAAVVEALSLTCQVNSCANTKVERLAAYDHNAVARFARGQGQGAGLVDLVEADDIVTTGAEILYVNCVRVDDYFDEPAQVVVSTIRGRGELAALTGAKQTLKQARLLFLDFAAEGFRAHPDKLEKVASLLGESFEFGYAPFAMLQTEKVAFTALLQKLVEDNSSGCMIFCKIALI
ncbi:hypothetical protein [Niveispirillum sp. KHB5.9]|uniref:hypothetical protein n=1 Tax=Niveispirillum sp. KHB5.9 TaxID=3400269 RepID=UPI003A898214